MTFMIEPFQLLGLGKCSLRLTDFHIAGVMAVAIAVAAIGLYVLRRSKAKALVGCAIECDIEIPHKPIHRWMFVAGVVFGTGWALTGACPGTVLAQLGELKVYAIFTAIGIMAGTLSYGAIQSRRLPKDR